MYFGSSPVGRTCCAGNKNVLGVVWRDVSVLCVFVRVAMLLCSALSLLW